MGMITALKSVLAGCLLLSFAGSWAADGAREALAAGYTKNEYAVPMRDGVTLFTSVYTPRGGGQAYPFLVTRTPYSAGVFDDAENLHYGAGHFPKSLGPSPEFSSSGYIFVIQDVRGRFMSGGRWQEATPHVKAPGMANESEDMFDTVEWLLKNIPNNNGRVGIWGFSYPGFFTAASIIDSHPAIKAASPQAPVTNLFMGDDLYHGGAFMLSAAFDFYTRFTDAENPTPLPSRFNRFDYGTGDGYEFFLQAGSLHALTAKMSERQRRLWTPLITHTSYDGFWKARALAPHLRNIGAAVLTVGGWYDAEDLQGTLTTHARIDRQNPGTPTSLVMGPWAHGAWQYDDGEKLGPIHFGQKTSKYFQQKIIFPFFEHHLKDAVDPRLPKVIAFETGSNAWRNYEAWPPKQAEKRTLSLSAGSKLVWNLTAKTRDGFDEFVSDPGRPVRAFATPELGVPATYMVADQRFAAHRPDVLVYVGDVLEQDLTVVGPVTPSLFVSTSGTDSDWIVKLIDVHPAAATEGETNMAGYQQLVRGEPMRGKFRNSFEHPSPFVPGKVEKVSFSMPDVNHTFRKGHRIMVQVQSSWFPLTDRNPQRFMDIPSATPRDFQKARQRVYFGPRNGSAISFGVLPSSQ